MFLFIGEITGQTSMPPVKMSGNTIVDGNHRFIAAKLCKMNAPKTQWNMSMSDASKAYPVRNINVDSFDWGNR